MSMNENQVKKNDGIPDVSEQETNKWSMAYVLLPLLLVIAVGGYFYTKPKQKQEKSNEEIYTLHTTNVTETKSAQLETTQVANTVQPEAVVQAQPTITTEQLAFIQEKQKALQQRLSAPLMVVNNNTVVKSPESSPVAAMSASDSNTQFFNQAASQRSGVENASMIGSLSTIVAEGSMIHATMESASNSDLPGSLRASVSEPVYAEDGSQILVPVGSRLIGQYKSGMLQGQTRIFIAWTRLITPEGVSVNLGSPGTDNLGVAGVAADEIDRHFWLRFGTASLLSLISAGASNVSVNGEDQQNSASLYREAVANSFSQSASQSLQQQSMIAPTLQTYQGKPIMVFVAKDSHFANVMKQSKAQVNIF